MYCWACYRCNGALWALRCVCRHGYLQRVPGSFLDYVVLRPREVRRRCLGNLWIHILLGQPVLGVSAEDSESSGEEEEYWRRMVADPNTPPFWRLQFSFREDADGLDHNLIEYVVRYIV